MYYFSAKEPAEPLVLTRNEQICGQTCQYLKRHQIDAIRFVHSHLSKGDFCILNDESGLGKTAVVSALLGAVIGNTNKKCLIIVNDELLMNGWLFHLNLFTDLSSAAISDKGKKLT